jgi:hypothetical protein
MSNPSAGDEAALDPAAARIAAKAEGSAPAEVTALLPKGARVVATGTAEDRITVTIDVGGAIEIRTFDAKTLKPAGRLKFATEP